MVGRLLVALTHGFIYWLVGAFLLYWTRVWAPYSNPDALNLALAVVVGYVAVWAITLAVSVLRKGGADPGR
jgi:hypothetical protein